MNAILKELYEQARLHAKTVDADLNPQEWMDEYHKKFAELIIDKCVRACVENIADPRDTIELQCAQKIKSTFGIK